MKFTQNEFKTTELRVHIFPICFSAKWYFNNNKKRRLENNLCSHTGCISYLKAWFEGVIVKSRGTHVLCLLDYTEHQNFTPTLETLSEKPHGTPNCWQHLPEAFASSAHKHDSNSLTNTSYSWKHSTYHSQLPSTTSHILEKQELHTV